MADFFLGVDIGATSIKAALVSPQGELSALSSLPCPQNHQPDLANDLFTETIQNLIAPLASQASAIGLGSPGPLDSEHGIILHSANIAGLKNLPLVKNISDWLQSQQLARPVFLENDANCAALGQLYFGQGRQYPDFAVLTLGTGVGGGLILGSRLYSGYQGNAMEIGHVPLAVSSASGSPIPRLRCGCGAWGCLETYASATGISRLYQHFSNKKLDARAIATLARTGDPAALEAFSLAGHALGQALVSLVHLLNLPAVILTGGLANAADLLSAAIDAEINDRMFPVLRKRFSYSFTSGDEHAGILGAAALARNLAGKP